MSVNIVLASACLLGIHSTYNGKQARRRLNVDCLTNKNVRFIPFCPEQIAGFATPRPPVEIQGGDGADVLAGNATIMTEMAMDVTNQFLDALDDILTLVQWVQPTLVILQQRSPSCSCAGIYDGTFSHTLVPGDGVVAAFLKQHGYRLMDIMDFNGDTSSYTI
ncbi:MAG: hypothetical protein OMM_08026 [Candidatus Magnetoglobus multicellularis str. Araruama]|uniref:Uncharacterized protein n=1 Tax=Candidatus Magnetoglobus multicellularis str. Araruama TaxID=890399 RepID=A0A1V1PA68_9BACT|nr:MAG: hypothetical protein OMM_08026 [Candidatus Magnetoglobus multicellularis str. Araruama]